MGSQIKMLFFGHTLEINQIQSFQVHFSSINNESDGVIFKIYCPCQYNSFPHKLIMYQDRSLVRMLNIRIFVLRSFLLMLLIMRTIVLKLSITQWLYIMTIMVTQWEHIVIFHLILKYYHHFFSITISFHSG